ncbi:MAG: efflux RND transporter periplasmic adaptor subunit, partial [Armatimonadetes bacterium]|nr:efflux RND transporter periplasmic adaptor subunit [Armatimonadota bacterium]
VAWSHLQRQRQLARLGAFGQPRVEEARAAAIAAQGEVATARNQVAAARNQVAEARSERAARDGEVASAAAEADSARSEVAEAESQLRALQAALAQAHTQVGVAQSRFERADLLLKEQLVSRQEWEQAQAERQRAQADVDAARASIAQGQAKIEAAKARLNAAQARAGAARGRRQQATASIETALARQAQAEAKLAAIQKQSEIASQALAREEAVFQGGYLTSQEIVAAEAAWRQAQLDQQAAADSVRLLGGSPGGTNALTVTAPLGGRVTERLVTLGEMVTPDRTLFTIINLHTVWLQLNVHQQDLPGVRTGQRVTVTSDIAPGRTFSGAISYVGDMVDETTRTVKVRCVVQNKGGRLRPQTFVRGTIATDVRAPVLAVPQDAVQTYAGKTVVFAQGERPGEFEAKEVQTGASVDGWTVIASGLAAGDRVVTRGAFIIKAQAMKSELEHHD